PLRPGHVRPCRSTRPFSSRAGALGDSRQAFDAFSKEGLVSFPITENRLAANRANARKSPGPRTAAGKRRASRNSTTAGLFCRHVVFRREDLHFFNRLREDLIDTHRPQNLTELHLVDRMV